MGWASTVRPGMASGMEADAACRDQSVLWSEEKVKEKAEVSSRGKREDSAALNRVRTRKRDVGVGDSVYMTFLFTCTAIDGRSHLIHPNIKNIIIPLGKGSNPVLSVPLSPGPTLAAIDFQHTIDVHNLLI